MLLKEDIVSDTSQVDSNFLLLKEKLTKRRKVAIQDKIYIELNFFLGYAAQVERLWSTGKYVLTDHRASMTPELFEPILILREDAQFWNLRLVAQSISKAKK